jgi:replication factor C large subunit
MYDPKRWTNWCEKYRPQRLSDVVGNRKSIEELKRWAEGWREGKPGKKGLVLLGNPGIGKTTSALALANDFGWTVVELNASDQRSADSINRIVKPSALNESFDLDGNFVLAREGKRKLIVLDEVDNLYEGRDKGKLGDKGGKQAIVEALRISQQPMVLIANNQRSLFKGVGNELKKLCSLVKFLPIDRESQFKLLKTVCAKEEKRVEPEVLWLIVEHSSGDLRSALNDLQSICTGKNEVRKTDTLALGYRERETVIFEGIREIFRNPDLRLVRKKVLSLGEEPKNIILWIDENLPYEYQNPDELSKAYDCLVQSDLFIGRSLHTQQYKLWRHAIDLMSCGVAGASKRPRMGYTRYQFPQWLIKMKRTQRERQLKRSIGEKLGGLCHLSRLGAQTHQLPFFRQLFKSDKEFAQEMTSQLNLSREEIKLLMEEEKEKKERSLFDFSIKQ